MGGVATDLSGRTTLAGLWAVGEVASTGLHGANRLASNSLLEAVVFGARVADDIGRLVTPKPAHPVARTYRTGPDRPLDGGRRAHLIGRLRRTMSEHVGVVRTGTGLERALAVAREIGNEAGDDRAVANMALAAEIIAGSALLRTESRGAHFRSDFPKTEPALQHRSAVLLRDIRAIGARGRPAAARCREELHT
jgi:L-aspartate oxidase